MSALSDISGAVVPGTGGAISLIEKIFGSFGGHKHERFSDPEKLSLYVSFRDSFIIPYLKNTYGVDLYSTDANYSNKMAGACDLLYHGQIDSVQFHRPQNETGAAYNDANRLVGYKGTGPFYDVQQAFLHAWYWLTWDMWKQDPADLIYNQRWVPMLKIIDAWVGSMGLKPIAVPSPANVNGPKVDYIQTSAVAVAAARAAASEKSATVSTPVPSVQAGISSENSGLMIILGLAIFGAIIAFTVGRS